MEPTQEQQEETPEGPGRSAAAIMVRGAVVLGVLLGGVWLASGLVLMGCFWVAHQANEQIDSMSLLQALVLASAIWVAFLVVRTIRLFVPTPHLAERTVHIDPFDGNYTGWHHPLMVTLTQTTNEYLAGQLPLRGLLMVHEMDTKGFAQRRMVTFQNVDANGRPRKGPVHVDDAEFTYTIYAQGGT